jgi:hypothetical protein
MRLGHEYYDKAIAHFDKAITIKPDKPWAKLNKATVMTLQTDRIGDARAKTRHIEAAEKVYQEALACKGIDEKSRYLVQNMMGILAIKRDDNDKALERFKKAYEMKKDDYLVCRNLGILYYKLKNYADAKRFFGESVKLKKGQEEVEKVLKVLETPPTIESATLRYTTDSKPVIGVKAAVRSCPLTVEDCRVEASMGRTPAFFRVRPYYVTVAPAGDLQVGKYKLNIRLLDPAGNKTARSFDFSVDRSPPQFAGVTPKAGGAVKGNNPTIVIRAWDELSAVDPTSIYLKYMTGPGMDMMVSEEVIKDGKYIYDMPALNIEKGQALGTDEQIKFVPKNSLPEGIYRIQIQGRDVVGNKSQPSRWDFHIIE